MPSDKPMDKNIKALLVMTWEHILDYENVLGESVKVHTALHRAMCEIHSGFDAVYTRHYNQIDTGPIGQTNRAKLVEIRKLVADLKNLPEQ